MLDCWKARIGEQWKASYSKQAIKSLPWESMPPSEARALYYLGVGLGFTHAEVRNAASGACRAEGKQSIFHNACSLNPVKQLCKPQCESR